MQKACLGLPEVLLVPAYCPSEAILVLSVGLSGPPAGCPGLSEACLPEAPLELAGCLPDVVGPVERSTCLCPAWGSSGPARGLHGACLGLLPPA